MSGGVEILTKVFGTKAAVESLDALHQNIRVEIGYALRSIAIQYANDVVTIGLAEQGIQSRSGELKRRMVIRGSIGYSRAWMLVYPGAQNAQKYRYPWAIGQGSPKNETMVKGYVRKSAAGTGKAITFAVPKGNVRKATKNRGERQRITWVTAQAAQKVKPHWRKLGDLKKAKPFMSGGALSNLRGSFEGKMRAALEAAIAEGHRITTAETSDFDGIGIG